MDEQQHIDSIRAHGWNQGHVLSIKIVEAALTSENPSWPKHLNIDINKDWLIIVSHPCDVLNRRSSSEPFVEVLLARPVENQPYKLDSTFTHGRNSRRYHFEGIFNSAQVKLEAFAFDRFLVKRTLLAIEPPISPRSLEKETINVLRDWIAKRYIRQAFPDAFDQAANTVKAKKKVDDYLVRYRRSQILIEVFVAFPDRSNIPFNVNFMVVVNPDKVAADWPVQKQGLEDEFSACWDGADGINIEVVALSANQVTLAELLRGRYMKFDRDWISNEYDLDTESTSESMNSPTYISLC